MNGKRARQLWRLTVQQVEDPDERKAEYRRIKKWWTRLPVTEKAKRSKLMSTVF